MPDLRHRSPCLTMQKLPGHPARNSRCRQKLPGRNDPYGFCPAEISRSRSPETLTLEPRWRHADCARDPPGQNVPSSKTLAQQARTEGLISVNTNVGAMIALQYLNKTTSELGTTQNNINSGLKIANAGQRRRFRHCPEHARRRCGVMRFPIASIRQFRESTSH
jgi:hypothetical protein